MKIYIAGPMTGYENWNFAAFDAAKKRLADAGYDVLSPADLDRQFGFDPQATTGEPDPDFLRRALRIDVEAICWADAVVLLPGWQQSKGARFEVCAAMFLGIPIYEEETAYIDWTNDKLEIGVTFSVACETPLTFEELTSANRKRCEASFHGVDEWGPTDWACAMAGEAGEACNLVKKQRRGDAGIEPEDIGKELADTVIYADLLASRLKLDLGSCVASKFNEVSRRVGSHVVL